MKKKNETKKNTCVSKVFHYIKGEIFQRLSVWIDESVNRVAEWITRTADAETWEPPKKGNQHNVMSLGGMSAIEAQFPEYADLNADDDDLFSGLGTDDGTIGGHITWALFIRDAFSFIYREIDIYFDHLKRFPSEAMSTAIEFFNYMSDLVIYCLQIVKMSIGDTVCCEKEKNTNTVIFFEKLCFFFVCLCVYVCKGLFVYGVFECVWNE